ncbi:MAG TPA: fibronectin type III domain-containing protein [Candidatus Polarisedimenticolaceae bacterium]|nr:fibronectin type III domain-containing protein [Candidatus Polarisedimenticolaceae bacterium]
MARDRRRLSCSIPAWSTTLALLLGSGGCGEKGPPLPPEPRGPFPPEQVRVRQVGAEVRVGFVVPVARGGKQAQQPVRAELVRVTYPPGIQPTGGADPFRRRGEIVAVIDGDPLPAGEARTIVDDTLDGMADGARDYTTRYGVRVRDRRGRPSPLVVAADLTIASVARAAGELRGEATADGIRLAWAAPPGEGPFRYNVYRLAGEQSSALDEPLNRRPLEETEYLDTTVATGERYTYLVRVALSEGRPYVEGEDGAAITLLAQDRFAPSSPVGLVAVQEGVGVRLFWDPNPERDIRGYRVYRRVDEGEVEGLWEPLGTDPIERPLYLDTDVRVGQRLVYRVTAVDRATPPNESAPSASQTIDLRTEPGVGS